MKVLKAEDMAVAGRSDGRVLLMLPVGDRKRQIVMEAEAAQRIGTVLANTGFDQLGGNPGYGRASAVRLRPYDASGDALIELTLERFGGPVVLVLGPAVLAALAQAADAALQFGAAAGQA